ncbi:unnamed protein product [Anisakis simplex]|uniref:Uncharacterized protein n=1 Tax=Anisakis simplex TaxID=6269 RepID=A0A3P6PLW6_ANISI|nr:unnamed protein product [Anisakis simplex]
MYTSKADEIRNSLTELRDLIISRRKDYISAVGHCNGFALSTSKGMSEWERKEMDDETECAIRQCSQLIRSFQQQIRCDQNLRAADQLIHLEEVAKILNNYLKRVTKMITELRSVRLRRTAAMNRMTKLSTMVQLHENEMRSRKQNSPGNNQELREDQYNGTNMLLGDSQGASSTAKISDSTEHPHSPSSGVRRRRKHTKGFVRFIFLERMLVETAI